MQSLDTMLELFRRAVRGLRRAPGFTAAVVASLALGVGANTAIFALVRHALLRPLPYPAPSELLAVGTSTQHGMSWEVADYNLTAWERESRTLAGIAWVNPGASAVVGGDSAAMPRLNGVRAAPSLLEVLRVRPVLGRWFTQEEALQLAPVVVVSHALWQRAFGGDPGVVGRGTLRIRDQPHTIIGVLPPGVGYPATAEFWYPYPDNLAVEVIARARPGVPLADVRRELRALAPHLEDSRERFGIFVDFVVATLHERLYGPNGPILRLLLGTVVLLFGLACTNVANLALARTLERRRELAVCVALGASRGRLAAQVLAEHAVLALAGGVAGVVLALWVTGVLVHLSPPELRGVRGAEVGAGGVLFAAGATMLAVLVISIPPVLAITRGDLRGAMGQPGALGAGSRAARRTRGGLVVGQLAIALLLLTASGLLLRSMGRLLRIDTGFDPRGLVILDVPLWRTRHESATAHRALAEALVTRLQGVPGVRSVALGPAPLVGGQGRGLSEGFNMVYSVRDSTLPGAPSADVWVKFVDPAYLETFRIPVRAGRGLTATDDARAPAVALVNARAARLLFPDGPALGRTLARAHRSLSEGRPITVVGVLPDVRQRDLTIPAAAELWLPIAQQGDRVRTLYLAARTEGNPEALVGTLRQLLAALDPELKPNRLSTMREVIRTTLAPERYVLGALGAFTALALLLAALGLYAVMAYLTATRTREFGVRLALGARPGQVLWLVLRGGLRLAALGIAVGLPVAYAASGVLARYLYEVEPRDGATFLAAPVVLVLAALGAAYLPARRATRVDPVTALRAD